MTTTIYVGDCRDILRTLPSGSVHATITSPPYWNLRNYGIDGQCGLEPTSDEYVDNLVAVFHEVRRVMRNDAVLYLNLGDSYQDKQLQGIPWRVALALQADGWYLRSDIIWQKKNAMPESVTDRPTKSHEYVFLLTKASRYFYDADSIREANASYDANGKRVGGGVPLGVWQNAPEGISQAHDERFVPNPSGRNKRSVWTVPTQPYSGAHFATFPPALVEPMIKAGTSKRGCCPECGNPWERVVEKNNPRASKQYRERQTTPKDEAAQGMGGRGTYSSGLHKPAWRKDGHATCETIGWQPTCACGVDDTVPCVCLDPFAGAGTVGLVADRLQRDAILIELSPTYAEMARRRIEGEAPMFTSVAVERV